MNDTNNNSGTDNSLAGGTGPRFKAHSGTSGASAGTARSGDSTYQGGDYLTEDEWRARRRPVRIEEIVDRLMAKVSGGRGAPAALLGARWNEVVGDSFTDKTRPGSCESGRLVILVVDGATASKMRFATPQIMQKAREIAGDGKVSSIAFRVSPHLRL